MRVVVGLAFLPLPRPNLPNGTTACCETAPKLGGADELQAPPAPAPHVLFGQPRHGRQRRKRFCWPPAHTRHAHELSGRSGEYSERLSCLLMHALNALSLDLLRSRDICAILSIQVSGGREGVTKE